MNRRATDSGHSLELLLDTICNMFGCIVFIAMLLSLFAGSDAESLAKGAAGMGADDAMVAKGRLEELRRQLDRSAATLDQLRRGVPEEERSRVATDAALVADLERDVALAEARLAESKAISDRVTGQAKSVEKQLAGAESRRQELKAEKDQLVREIERQRMMRAGEARLPVVRDVDDMDRELMIIIEGGQAYAWRHSQPKQATMVTITSLLGGGQRVRPILGRGIRVTTELSSEPRWNAIVSQIKEKKQTAYAMVYPDSVNAFMQVRVDLLNRGIMLKLCPIPEGESITLVRGHNTVD